MTTHVKRAFKYRFYPTEAQAAELSRTFGCVRKVYNMALAARTEAWARQERVNYNQTSAMLTAWKKTEELAYLNEVSSVPLQQALRHLQAAFASFFAKRAKYPRFKAKKKSRASAEYTSSAFRFRDGLLYLAKMADPLDIAWSRPLPDGATPTTVTASRDSAGRWFVSLLCEDPSVKPLAAAGTAVGIDVGLEHLLTLSTGRRSPIPGTSAATASAWPKRRGSCPARPRATAPIGVRSARGSPGSTPGSPTAGVMCCTN